MGTTTASRASAPPDTTESGYSARLIHRLLCESRSAAPAERGELEGKIVELSLPLARRLAHRYVLRGVPAEDLEQVALLGLLKAIRGFDVDRGPTFFGYAIPTIRGEIRRHFRDAGWMVRPPRRLQELQPRIWTAERTLAGALGRDPTNSELATHLQVTETDVVEARCLLGCFRAASLDRPLQGAGQRVTLGDRLGTEESSYAWVETMMVLGPALQELSARDRRILELRFGQNMTQSQIGADLGVTQMQVSRLLSRILRELRGKVPDLDGATLECESA